MPPCPRALLLELKQMKDLHHDHLTRFLGACLDSEPGRQQMYRVPVLRVPVVRV